MSENQKHISVCIPTFKRPEMLHRCLEGVRSQTQSGFDYSVVVVDNDAGRSAKRVADLWRERFPGRLGYFVETEQNIALARNKAIANSSGGLLAFIDDDEFPEPSWLLNLLAAFEKYSVDGVLGPVIPSYEGNPPEWLVKSELCVRKPFPTGTLLRDPRYMRTGNVLFSRHILGADTAPFDPRFGRTGGEDAHFFEKQVRLGRCFVWCDEARVFETVPRERQQARYFVKRALIRGVTSADDERFLSLGTLKSVTAVLIYTASLPFLLLAGRHFFMKYFIRDCDHVSKLLAHCGIRLVRERGF